jgi:ELWxxDGT repeat protein
MTKQWFFFSNGSGLWESDGTQAGTQQISGAASPAQFDFTAFDNNSELLYSGLGTDFA